MLRSVTKGYGRLFSTSLKNFGPTSKPFIDGTYLGDSLAVDGSIETVELSYDKYSPTNEPSSLKSPLVFLHGLFGSRKIPELWLRN